MDDDTLALNGVRALLRILGRDPNEPGLVDTPARVLRAYREMGTSDSSACAILGRTFDGIAYDGMVTVGPIPFTSLCEHHLLPFTGTAWVAYLPHSDRVVGLSKLARLVEHYARRPQVQERLTTQITDALDHHLEPLGSACLLRATHGCMAHRGVRAAAQMVTSSLTGAFRDNPATRTEFLAITR